MAAQVGSKNLEDLATALADAGYLKSRGPLALAPVAREEIGRALWERLQEPRHTAFAQLLTAQQEAVILFRLQEGDTPQAVAAALWVDPDEVRRVWHRYSELVGQDICQLRFESFVGHMTLRAEQIHEKAMAKGDVSTASNTLFRYVKAMQDLGVLYRAPTQVEHSLTVEEGDQADQEAERIVKVKAKLLAAAKTEEAPA